MVEKYFNQNKILPASLFNKKAQGIKSKILPASLFNKKAQGIKSKILPASLFNKKAQMKIQQMAFMLIAVMVFFGLIALVIIAVKFSGLKGQATDIAEQNAMLLVSKLANSPEFSCGKAFGGSRVSCVDFDKAMALKKKSDKYKDFWRVSKIEILKIYPKNSFEECTEGNYPDCGKITILSGNAGISTENFVSLCRKDYDGRMNYDKCELAKILVSYEKVQ